MKTTSYQNFDLEVYKTGGVYQVIARSMHGETKHPFTLPFDIAQIKSLCPANFAPKFSLDFLKEYGGKLFDSLLPKEIHANYKSSLSLAQVQAGKGLRLRLHFNDAPEFVALPWEYLYEAALNQFVALNRQTPLVRYLDIPQTILPLRIKLPLEILVVLSSPANLPYFDVDTEKEKLCQALSGLTTRGLVQVKWLEKTTVAALQKTLRRTHFHILHYIGYGGFDEVAQQGWLALHDADKLHVRTTTEQLGALLSNHASLRLVVLNSCEGARVSLANSFFGAATALVQRGIPAALAMQFAISNDAAIKFSETFYGAIADGLPVDVATIEARVALFASGNHPEWGTPVLFMRTSDGLLFDLPTKLKSTEATKPSLKRKKGLTATIYAALTLFFAALSFFILSILPKSTAMEIEAFAKSLTFSLSNDLGDEENIALLHDPIWTQEVSLEKFQPLQLLIYSLDAAKPHTMVEKVLFIRPDSLNGKITFFSAGASVSLQEIKCSAQSGIKLQRDDDALMIEIARSVEAPTLTLSLTKSIDVKVQACKVRDGAGHDLTAWFSQPLRLQLHDLSQALTLVGVEGVLHLRIKRDRFTPNDKSQYIIEQPVENLEFTRTIYRNMQMFQQSTLDSLLVTRNFPLDNYTYKSRDAGDLEIMPAPNRFIIYSLSEAEAGLKIRAQGQLKSLTVGRGALKTELVPRILSLLAEYPSISLSMTCLGWVTTVLIPLLRHFKNKREVDDD